MNNTPVSEQGQLTADEVGTLTEFRGGQWQAAINAELQDLITQASELRALINESKTGTKKRYYEKKFKKVQTLVLQSLVVKQRIDAKLGSTELVDALKAIDEADAEYKASTSPVDSVVEHYTPTATAI